MHPTYRIGFGEDAHELTAGRHLVIGGIEIPGSPKGSDAHSDGDALLHALSDAFLSAFAMGDIGQYFPPTNPNYKDLDSRVILQTVLERLAEAAGVLTVHNISAVVTLDQPRLGPHRTDIQRHIAELLELSPTRVGLSFKTSEGLAPDFIQARATVLVSTPDLDDEASGATRG